MNSGLFKLSDALTMARRMTGNRVLLIFFVYSVAEIAHSTDLPEICPPVSCGTTFLENGDSITMVPKLITSEEAWWLKEVPGLEAVERKLICRKPDCLSNPCPNGATCTETLEGFACDYPVPTTPNPSDVTECVYHTQDDGTEPAYTIIGHLSGETSLDFQVSASKDARLGLFQITSSTANAMYEITIGHTENTGVVLQYCNVQNLYLIGGLTSCEIYRANYDVGTVYLSGTPSFDHYYVSFADGHIVLRRYGTNITLMDQLAPILLDINYVGIHTTLPGSWIFDLFC